MTNNFVRFGSCSAIHNSVKGKPIVIHYPYSQHSLLSCIHYTSMNIQILIFPAALPNLVRDPLCFCIKGHFHIFPEALETFYKGVRGKDPTALLVSWLRVLYSEESTHTREGTDSHGAAVL